MQVNEIFFIGSNKYGQLGSGEKNNSKTFEIPKSYDFGIFIKQVSCGYHHSAVLTISGHLYTMGSNVHGTLGSRQ
jgi:alpha-tubulin suppressor-like RCC1 family protein